MSQVSIVYHSGYGHTEKAAKSVLEGVKSVGNTIAHLISVANIDSNWEILKNSSAIIFGSPTYMGSASAPFKDFMDKSSKIWMTQDWKDKIAGGFTVSGSQSGDKLSTLEQFMVFAAQHGMIWVSLGILPGNNSSKSSVNDLNRLGSSIGPMAQANVDQGADAMIESDLKTLHLYGKRIAEITHKFSKA
ncbi:flavodoxin family protein [Pigmentibacter ruber]|uniref:flavodoxin family protein n=1 Tax=Pigmentibacter ruber TaxID=2683196 RepID=UPI00131C8AA9|nr:flavodoxin family protein [Pigmentibacter ruber]BFD31610.1 flavodoxin family protein [Pigmentibacter ruber]